MSIRSYLLLVAVLAGFVGAVYVSHLRRIVADQYAKIEQLEATEVALRAAQKALEETVARRAETQTQINTIKEEVTRAPDAALPAPIERAFDGLRRLQARP